jgi:hypothetical protein
MDIGKSQQQPVRFTPTERRLIRRLRSPMDVQRFINRLPYNTEPKGDTLRGFRGVAKKGTAHCLEAALFAACVMEQHGYPPLLMGLESVDLLDHVIFVYKHRGRWGSVARSRDPGLHGRKPVFRSPRALAESYYDPYIDQSLFGGASRHHGELRLAVVEAERLGRREHAAQAAPPQNQTVKEAREAGAEEVPRVCGEA